MKNKTLINGIIIVVVVNLLFLTSLFLCLSLGFGSWQFSIFITLFMFAYHFDMRIIIGLFFTFFVRKKINTNSKIFDVSEKEFNFLQKLGVKKWKDRIITLYKNSFTLEGDKDKNKIEIVLKNNINAEIIHWVCFFAGFFAIVLGCVLSADEWYIYVITATLASLLADLPSILVQRFNRLRLKRIRR